MNKYKNVVVGLIVLAFLAVSFAVEPINYSTVSNPRRLERLLRDRIGTLDDEVTALQGQQSGLFSNIGTGTVFYVDSVTGADTDTGLTWALAKATIDAGVGLCTDGNHDVIYVASGHEETLTADINFDIDDITVIGIGSGTVRPEITLDTGTDSLVIDAIGVTLYNLSLIAGCTEVAGGITLNDESDYARIISCVFPEPGTAAFEFDVGIQFVNGADNVTIAYNTFTSLGQAGCTSFIDFGAGVIDGATIVGNNVKGDMLVAGIFSDQSDTNLLIANNMIRNTDADQHAIELKTGAATGIIAYNLFLCSDLDTTLDPGSCATYENYANTSTDQTAVAIPLVEIKDVAGSVFYLDGNAGTDAVTHGRSWAAPFDTLTYAVAACASDNGDVIYVAPGHLEALTTSAITLNVDGIKIIGLGVGSDRPTITFAHGDSSIVISADDLMIKNFIFSSITAPTNETIDVTGPGVVLEDCMWIDDGTQEHQICVTLDAAAEKSTIRNCVFYSTDATGPTSAISIVGGVVDRLVIEGCRIWGDYSDAGIQSDQINTNALIKDCTVTNNETGQHAIQLSDAMTGDIINCRLYGDTPTAILDPGSMKCIGNIASGGVDLQSFPIPLEESYAAVEVAGSTFYVDSAAAGTSDAATHGGSWKYPYATINYAVGTACSADSGDVVYVAPGHALTLTSALTLDTDGVALIGMGVGSDRPTITFTGANASILISADDFKIKNFIFTALTTAPDETLDVTGPGVVIEDCLWTDDATNQNTISLTLDAAAENSTVRNCDFLSADTAGATSAISIVGGVVDRLIIEDCRIYGDFTDAAIVADDAHTKVLIKNNEITNVEAGVHAIEFSTTATGEVSGNMLYGTSSTAILDPGSMKCFNNFGSNGIDSASFPIPAPDAEGKRTGPGQVFYVDAGTPGAGDGRSWSTAIAKLDDAINLCSDDRGDTIYIAPGHTETLGLGGNGVDIDLGSITVIGLGSGESVPFFDYDTTTDEFVISATGTNAHIKNLRFHSNVPTADVAIDIEASTENWVIEDCVFDAETANTDYFDNAIVVNAGAHNGVIRNCRFYAGSGAAVSAINFLNSDSTRIIDNSFYGDYSTAAITNGTTASIHIEIIDNIIFNGTTGGIGGLNIEPCIELKDDTTGVIINNKCFCDVATPEAAIVGADMFMAHNTYSEIESTAGSRLIGDDQSIDVDIAGLSGKGTGQVWYVDVSGSGEDGRSWGSAFATVNAAVGVCTANAGDIILVAEGHFELLAGADAIDLDSAGISLIGMGASYSRPRFDLTDAGAEVVIGAANVTVKNIQLRPGATSVLIGIEVEATGLNAMIDGVDFLDGEVAATDEFVDGIVVHNTAVGVTIKDCTYHCTGGDGDTFVNLDTGAAGNITIEGCTVWGDFDEAGIWGSTQICTNLNIRDNTITNNQAGQACIEFQGAATGHLIGNRLYGNPSAATPLLDPGSLKCFNNVGTNVIDESSFPVPGTIPPDNILASQGIARVLTSAILYVDSINGNDTTGDGLTWDTAEASLEAAYDDVTTDTGTIIYLAPNHTETISSAASIEIDLINVTMIGLGHGDSRPLITLYETSSSIDVTAADNRFENIVFESITADATICFSLAAGADGTEFINCEFRSNGNYEFLSAITFATGTDDVTIKGCKFTNGHTAATEAIQITTGITVGTTIEDCEFFGAWTAAGIYCSAASTDVRVYDNVVYNSSSGVHAIEFSSTATGSLVGNKLYSSSPRAILDAGSLTCHGNTQSWGLDMSGMDVPLVPGRTYTMAKTDGACLAGDDPIFDIVGGPIEVLSIYGLVTSPIVGISNMTLNATDTLTTTQTAISSTVAIDNDPAGDTYTFSIAAPPVLVPVTAGVQSGIAHPTFFLPEGHIDATGSAARDGVIEWYITFRVMKAGTYVIPAT